MAANPNQYESYLKLLNREPQMELDHLGKEIIQKFKIDQPKYSRFSPVPYLVDYTRNQYIYVDESCFELFGFTAKQVVEEKLDGFLEKWHPSDYEIMNRHIFPDNLAFLNKVPLSRYSDFVFSFNYRVLDANQEYIMILQRSSYLPGKSPGSLLGNVGVVLDISHYKTDNSVVHTIEEVKKKDGALYNELRLKKVYQTKGELLLSLSKRELDVLSLMTQGFASKQIAYKLNISINTVNNHRKNMLQKTGCISSTELVKFAFKHGYL